MAIGVSTAYTDFDPFLFLELTNLSPQEKERLRPILLERIVEFLLLKVAQEKGDIITPNITLEEIFSLVASEKVAMYLEEFKNNFKKAHNGNGT